MADATLNGVRKDIQSVAFDLKKLVALLSKKEEDDFSSKSMFSFMKFKMMLEMMK